ncbi:MAG: sodium:calcium antiporter [Bacillota bacterium]
MISAALIFTVSLAAVGIGANWLTSAAVFFAQRFRIPEQVIGATLLSLATTLPELAVTVNSAITGHPELALGNALGSIIFNTGVILSVVCIISPVQAKVNQVKGKYIILGLALLAAYLVSLNGWISRTEGLALFALTPALIITAFRGGHLAGGHDDPAPQGSLLHNLAIFLGGALLLAVGSRYMVSSAITIARLLGVQEMVIGVTIVAAGTSLPEFVTCVVAALRGYRGLSMGNILGANILNISWVVAAAAILAKDGLSTQTIHIDLAAAALVTFISFLALLVYNRLGRLYGISILIAYICYVLLRIGPSTGS